VEESWGLGDLREDRGLVLGQREYFNRLARFRNDFDGGTWTLWNVFAREGPSR